MLNQRLFVTLLLGVAAAGLTSAHAGESPCQRFVGHTFFADKDTPPLDFSEKRADGIHLWQHVAGGQKIELTSVAPGDDTDADLTIRAQDGRTLNIMCSAFEDAMGSSPAGQRIIESDAPDFETALARVKAKRMAAFGTAARCQIEGEQRRAGLRTLISGPRDALASPLWGKPVQRKHMRSASGQTEQWVYEDGRYLIFDGGMLMVIHLKPADVLAVARECQGK